MLNDIDNISSDDESVDYSPPKQQPLEPQVHVQNSNQQISNSDETNKSTPEISTDSSLDTSSIEVIQPNEGLAIKLPSNPPQCALPNSPESPRTNVAVPVPQDLFTEDEETGDNDVPPTETTVTPEVKGDRCRGSSAILLLYLVTAKLGGIPRRGPTTRLAALDAGRIPNRKGTSRCV